MQNADPETIRLIYRYSAVQVINTGAAVLNLAALSASVLTANAAARFLYRLNPYCPVCGLDAVDCKINRQSLSDHPQN